MARRTVIYDDFSQGEFGRLGASNAPKGSWTGSNMLMHRTGELGVRPGLRLLPITGIVSGTAISDLRTGFDSNDLMYIQGTAVRGFDLLILANQTAATALDVAPTLFALSRGQADIVYYSDANDDDTYSINTGASLPTVTKFAAAPGGRAVALYGDRLVVGGNIAAPHLLFYSAAGDPTTWPATNTIQIGGTSSPITALYTQRSHLVIHKTEGIFILTGVPGVNETLRQLTNTAGTGNQASGEILGANGMNFFVPNNYRSFASFDGTYDRLMDKYQVAPNGRMTYASRERNALVYLSPETPPKFWVYYKGSWTQHAFGPGITDTIGFVTSTDEAIVQANLTNTTNIVFASTGTTPSFYIWALGQDGPGSDFLESPLNNDPGDNSQAQVSGSFSMPEWYSDEGSEIVVRGVIVDFRDWNTGGSLTNHWDIRVDSYRNYDNASPIISHTESWDGLGSQASQGGTIRRKFISMGDQGGGNGFQLNFSNCRGVAFRRLEVIIESSSVRL